MAGPSQLEVELEFLRQDPTTLERRALWAEMGGGEPWSKHGLTIRNAELTINCGVKHRHQLGFRLKYHPYYSGQRVHSPIHCL